MRSALNKLVLVPDSLEENWYVWLWVSISGWDSVVQSYYADTWSYKRPAPLHPGERPVADHTSHIIHEAVSTCSSLISKSKTGRC